MRIAIQAADLDAARIDGTRVYIKNLLNHFGALDYASEFLIYHKNEFNPELKPANFPNYKIIKKSLPYLWTQTRFAGHLWAEKPDVLWMPMHNIPLFRRPKLKTVVTIHDLAFKFFPEAFTKIDLAKISLLTRLAVMNADKIITISQSSKRDILRFYPKVKPENIKIIYHGFSKDVFSGERNAAEEEKIKKELGINGNYILYIGALQPRKNLGTLIEAYNKLRVELNPAQKIKLVLVGEKAWLWKDIMKKIEDSPYESDIIAPGKMKFQDLGHLMRGAEVFCFPSLYEGFGIPILEAFSAGVPVVAAKNSSLPEVGGDAALYFDSQNSDELAQNIKKVLKDEKLRTDMIRKGTERLNNFSWEKCAQETLDFIKSC